MSVFDKNAKLLQRANAAKVTKSETLKSYQSMYAAAASYVFKAENVADFDYMKEEIGYRVSNRVLDIKRQGRD